MKKLLCVFVALFLCCSAAAEGSASLIRTFVSGDTLYTYVEIDGAGQPITQAEAKIGNQSFPATDTLETVQQAGFPVTYLLLVDNSTSMPAYREELTAFARGLSRSSGEKTKFTLATFGRAFSLVAQDLTADTLEEAVGGLPFDETASRLSACVDQALDHFEQLPREGGELRCMVVLSDAVEYDAQGGPTDEALLARVAASDVMLYSVGVGSDGSALARLGAMADASGGTHQVVDSLEGAAAAAEALTAENGRMFVTAFRLTGCQTAGEDQAVSVTFASGGTLVCRAESRTDLPELGETAPSGGTEDPKDVPPSPVSPDPSGGGTSVETDGPAEDAGVPAALWLAAALCVAALIAIVLALRALHRRNKRRADSPPAAPSDQGIFLRLEILQGAAAPERTEYSLSQQLVVGRDPACDIVLDNPSVSRRHARVFAADGRVYIEDLNSQNGTSVNGSPIRMPCALRSGDCLTTGDVVWDLKF